MKSWSNMMKSIIEPWFGWNFQNPLTFSKSFAYQFNLWNRFIIMKHHATIVYNLALRAVLRTWSACQPPGLFSADAISWDMNQSDLPWSWDSLCEVSGAMAISFLKSTVVKFVSGHSSLPQNLKTQFHKHHVKLGLFIQSWYFNSYI